METGLQALPVPPELTGIGAQFVDDSGAIIVGGGYDANHTSRILRWQDGVVSEVSELAGASACGLDRTGSLIVYTSSTSLGVFDARQGKHELRDLLAPSGVDLAGWDVLTAYGVSADARALVLSANYRAGDGRPRAVLVTLDADTF